MYARVTQEPVKRGVVPTDHGDLLPDYESVEGISSSFSSPFFSAFSLSVVASVPIQRRQPGKLRIRNFAIPSNERNRPNPVASSPNSLVRGGDLFLARCAGCQGVDGSGRTPIGSNTYPRVPNLRRPPPMASPMGSSITLSKTESCSRACLRLAAQARPPILGIWFSLFAAFGHSIRTGRRNSTRFLPRLTTQVRRAVKNVTRRSTHAGRRRRWRMSCAIRMNIPKPSLPIWPPTWSRSLQRTR